MKGSRSKCTDAPNERTGSWPNTSGWVSSFVWLKVHFLRFSRCPLDSRVFSSQKSKKSLLKFFFFLNHHDEKPSKAQTAQGHLHWIHLLQHFNMLLEKQVFVGNIQVFGFFFYGNYTFFIAWFWLNPAPWWCVLPTVVEVVSPLCGVSGLCCLRVRVQLPPTTEHLLPTRPKTNAAKLVWISQISFCRSLCRWLKCITC